MDVHELKNRLQSAVEQERERFRIMGPYRRLRALLVGAFVADVVVTMLVMLSMTSGGLPIDVSYRIDFPTRLIVVRNRARVMQDASVVLDDRFHYDVQRLDMGVMGIDLRDFRDPEGVPPDADYRPLRARIMTAEGQYELAVTASGGP